MKPGGDEDEEKQKNRRRIGLYTGIPSMFAAGLILGYLCGHWLDKRFKTDGLLTGLGFLLGLAASMYSIFKMIAQESKED